MNLIPATSLGSDLKYEDCFEECRNLCHVEKAMRKTLHRHCKLCGKRFQAPSRCKEHLYSSHIKQEVKFLDYTCFPCWCHLNNDQLLDLQKRAVSHYHCPVCSARMQRRQRFANHVIQHQPDLKKEPRIGVLKNSSKTIVKSSNEECCDTSSSSKKLRTEHNEGSSSSEMISEDHEHNENIDIKMSLYPIPVKKKEKCPYCDNIMQKNLISRHCREQHSSEDVSIVTCVDAQRWIHLVRKSLHGDIAYPVHVKKKVMTKLGNDRDKQCEEKLCMRHLKESWECGFYAAECPHLKQVQRDVHFLEEEELVQDALDDLSITGPYNLLSEEEVEKCVALQELSDDQDAPLLAVVKDGEKFIHFSVFEPEICKYSALGRLIVSCDMIKHNLDCRCCKAKHMCIHKNVCLWYLSQHKLMQGFDIVP